MLPWTPHTIIDRDPDFRALSDTEVAGMLENGATPEQIEEYFLAREKRIELSKTDPLRHGFDLPHWPLIRHYLQQKEEVYNFGGNDSGKTDLMAKITSEVATGRLTFPGMMEGAPQIVCMAQNETMSKRVQQARIYKYLPHHLRKANESGSPKKRNPLSKVAWSEDNGFTNATFTLPKPRGSACIFRNVTQWERNEMTLEGDGFHFIPVDESCPFPLLDTLQYRAGKKNGRILYCFTPVGGFDQVCNSVFTGARIIASLPINWDWLMDVPLVVPKGAEAIGKFLTGGINPDIHFPEIDLARVYIQGEEPGVLVKGCPPGHMPVVMQPVNFKQVIIFSWSHWNPFPPRSDFNRFLPKIADKCVGKGYRVSLCRLFGYVDKLGGALISNFVNDYYPKGHLIRHEDLLEILRKTPHNLRCGADPATARSWFIGWKAVLPEGLDGRPMQYLVEESPSAAEGEWVTDGGEKGDGTKLFPGGDVDFYKRYIRETEARIAREIYAGNIPPGYIRNEGASPQETYLPDPVQRAGDAKGFAAPTLGSVDEQKFLELFFRDDSAKDAVLAPMFFRPAKVRSTVIEDVHDTGKLIDLLSCDFKKEINATNHPHLLVSDRCTNTIKALLNWDGKKQNIDGKPTNSPYADPVDMMRILFDQEIPYVDPAPVEDAGGGAWG